MRSDAELVRAARSDPAAFRELYGRYAHQVYGFHVRRVRDADAAHDLTAETFAQAWQSRRRFRDRASGSAGPWLIGIARHVIAQSVRRRRIELAACAKLGLLERLDGPRSTVEPTVDQTKHVNGGCRSLNSAGTEWECYLGQTAVAQRIIGARFLGEYAPSPGVG